MTELGRDMDSGLSMSPRDRKTALWVLVVRKGFLKEEANPNGG